MEGYSRILSLLLPIFLHLASAWQKPNMEYLSSLKGKYQNLLQTLACENFDDSTEISNCATYMLHGKLYECVCVCVWRVLELMDIIDKRVTNDEEKELERQRG